MVLCNTWLIICVYVALCLPLVADSAAAANDAAAAAAALGLTVTTTLHVGHIAVCSYSQPSIHSG
jgi:hypothetical protein